MDKTEVLNRLEIFGNAQAIQKGLESNVHGADAKTKFEEYAKDGLLDSIWPVNSNDPIDSLYSDGAERDTALGAMSDEARENLFQNSFQTRQDISLALSLEELAKGDIYQNAGAYDENLLKIASSKNIVEAAQADMAEKFQLYGSYLGLEKLKGKIVNGGDLSKEEEKLAISAGGKGLAKHFEDSLKGRFNPKLVNSAITVASIVGGYDDERRKQGIDVLLGETETKLGADYKQDLSKGVAEILGNMANTGNKDDEFAAAQLYWTAQKDNSLIKDYKEVF